MAITGAEVYWRPSRADDEDCAPIVGVVGLGNWAFTDLESAAERVERAYPELSRKLCIRAARLISNQIGRRNRGVRQLPPRRDPIDREYDAYMLGKF